MISAWTKHLKTEDEKQRFRNSVLGAKHVINRLDELLVEEEEKLTRQEINVDALYTPNWDYVQAYWNGFRACLRLIRKLINLDQKEITE